ncbi:MAG TPA: glycerophosphodiester phosphodiesterase [Solirubrobacteraceae bacterium]|nr:glycerophosphodiester phosphodiesterase [Solirubrobacteraceae bacterium]
MTTGPSVIAHRGVHTAARENTMEAFALAVAAGADMIELDVRRTGDGRLAILHDPGHAGVALATGSLDAFADRTGLRPPLLDDVLDWAAGRIALDVELKEDGYVEEIAPLLERFTAAGGELLVTSFLDPPLAKLAALAPTLRLGLLLEITARWAPRRARAAGARVVLPSMGLVRESLLDAVTGAGLDLIVWDFMAADHGSLLSDARVAGVITDDVPGALAARAALAGRAAEPAP